MLPHVVHSISKAEIFFYLNFFVQHEYRFGYQVEENVAAAVELVDVGKDDETLSEVEAILKPVKNQTWPSGIQKS